MHSSRVLLNPKLTLSVGVAETILLGGLESKYMHKANYTVKNAGEVVQDFLGSGEPEPKDIRFNLLIDKKINKYLNEVSLQRGKTKAELMRELIIKDMKER